MNWNLVTLVCQRIPVGMKVGCMVGLDGVGLDGAGPGGHDL